MRPAVAGRLDVARATDSPPGRAAALRLLLVEDRPTDAALVLERLRRSDLRAIVEVVDHRAAFEAALGDPPDLILCDFHLPAFGALEVLGILERRAVHVPVIVISGALSDEEAVECLRQGAVDYLLKDRPARLVPAIRRALDDHRCRGAMQRSEDAFRDRAGLLQAVFETVADPIVVVDDEGRSVELNPAAQRLAEDRDEAATVLGNLYRQIAHGDTERGEIELPRGATAGAILEYAADRGFMANRHLVVLHDVSVRRALLTEAIERHRLESIGRLAGGIAHDFNNILAAIVTFAELALTELGPDSPVREEIGEVLHAADRAADLVGQILAFSRQQPVQPTVLDVRDILAHLDSILRRPLGSHIALDIEAGDGPASVYADRAQLERVIVNLVVNARDAMPGGGRITIRISSTEIAPGSIQAGVEPGRYVRVEVSDTGSGMDEATRARAFEPFFTTKPVGRGTGLGLATAYGTVEQLGGTITVDSAPGRGSVFVVLVPALPAAVDRTAADRTAAAEGGPGSAERSQDDGAGSGACPGPAGSSTILIAEDDPAVRSILTRVLGGARVRMLVAADGLEALAAADGVGMIDLLVSDVVMPGMTGSALAARLLDEDRVRRVLLISGYRGLAPVAEVELDPRVTFLAKPFDVGTLRDAVATALTP